MEQNQEQLEQQQDQQQQQQEQQQEIPQNESQNYMGYNYQQENIQQNNSFNGQNQQNSMRQVNTSARLNKSQLNQQQQLDPAKIMDYIQLLQDYEKQCIREGNFKEAEIATQRISELQQHELIYRSLAVVEKNKEEIYELEQLNLQQFNEFNQIWDQIIEEHVENLKQIEQNMIDQHIQEEQKFQHELDQLVIPKCKYSKDVLNMRYVLENMIKAKQYGEAHELKFKIANQEQIEQEKWEKSHREKYAKKAFQLQNKQRTELESLKVKLENSLQEKVKVRSQELEKLLQKFQNMKNELEVKQNQELSKLQVMNNKTLTKISNSKHNLNISAINTSNTSLNISQI